MHKVIRAAATISVIALVLSGSTVLAKPEMAPVRVEYAPIAPLRPGDEATTVLTLRALADVDRVDVTVAPFKGVELLSEPREVTFTAMKNGETREFTVTIRMTGERYGYLSVSYRTLQGKTIAGGATTIVYSAPGD
jgi:hypothetical protein